MSEAPQRVVVIGPGPAIIGEGGDIDAFATQAIDALRAAGLDVIVVTSNAATACSDPTRAYRTYIEPLDAITLGAIVEREKPTWLFPLAGGRASLDLALTLHENGTLERCGTRILGISPSALAHVVLQASGAASRRASLPTSARVEGFEVVALLDAEGEFEVLCILQSLERPNVHPGDAICVTPPIRLSAAAAAEIAEATRSAAISAGITAGLLTCELTLDRETEQAHAVAVSPHATRASALAAITTGLSLSTFAVRLALGCRLNELNLERKRDNDSTCVRWPRFPFEAFPDADAALGPNRKSLGESIGVGCTFADALRSAARGADDGRSVARPVRHDGTAPASKRVIVVGAGPSRIGQGPELAACAADALTTLRELGFESVYLDSNVEALAIARAFADHVHIEPITVDRILSIYNQTLASGVILQFGGDFALDLAPALEAYGARVFGTHASALSRARTYESPPQESGGELDTAIAVDVDVLSDGSRACVVGVIEHLEPSLIHSGDSAAILPAFTLHPNTVARIEQRARHLAIELAIVGLVGIRMIVAEDDIIVVDVEPRAGRTTAFVARATGFPLVQSATKVMLGRSLDELEIHERAIPRHVAARERVFPFDRLGVDSALGRAMRSTGEVTGLDDTPARAYAKALRAMGITLHTAEGNQAIRAGVLLSVAHTDLPQAIVLARRLRALGFTIHALGEVRESLRSARIAFSDVGDLEPSAKAAQALIQSGAIAYAVVTAQSPNDIARTRALRAATLATRVPCFTTMRLANLGCSALEESTAAATGPAAARVRPLQAWYADDK